jgi:transcriptional regulator with XRE-family HTH domain
MREPRTSGRQLARELGVDKDTLSAWRQGKSHPRAYQLPKLAEALGIGVEDLTPARAAAVTQASAGTPDLLKLLDDLARLSEAAHAVATVGEIAPDLTTALHEAKRLRRELCG